MRIVHNYSKEYNDCGGNTFCFEIINGKLFVGVSHCVAIDQFSKKIGSELAKENLNLIISSYKKNGSEVLVKENKFNSENDKIIGFVVNDELILNLICNYNYFMHNDMLFPRIFKHLNIKADIDYEKIEGLDMNEILILYYNELAKSSGCKYIENYKIF